MQEKASKELLRRLKRDYNECESDLLYSIDNRLPDNRVFYVIGLPWDCEKSPLGLCVYHVVRDTAHDQCVFCGNPAERK